MVGFIINPSRSGGNEWVNGKDTKLGKKQEEKLTKGQKPSYQRANSSIRRNRITRTKKNVI